VTVISLAQQPLDYVMRIFEDLTGLPTGTLVPDLSTFNSSVPYQVLEAIRAFNVRYWELAESDRDVYARVVARGAVRELKYAGGKELAKTPIGTPHWACDRAGEIMGQINTGLRASGVNVVGDLDALTLPSKPPLDSAVPSTLEMSEVAVMLLAMMHAADREGARRRIRPSKNAVVEVSGREALGLLRRRLTARIRRA
jgi:hypothetical protein